MNITGEALIAEAREMALEIRLMHKRIAELEDQVARLTAREQGAAIGAVPDSTPGPQQAEARSDT